MLDYLYENAIINEVSNADNLDAAGDEEYHGKDTYENYDSYTKNGVLSNYDIYGRFTGLGSISAIDFDIYSSEESGIVGSVNGTIGSSENRDIRYDVGGQIERISDNVYRLESQYEPHIDS